MKETIIFAPSLNGTELCRSLARFGKSTLGLRVMNGAELARFALMKSGIPVSEGFLPRNREAPLIDSFVRSVDYFKAASFADSKMLANALYTLRAFSEFDEAETFRRFCEQGEFPEKNKAIFEIYKLYSGALAKEGLIDTAALIKKAILEADCALDLVLPTAETLSPLEMRLAKKLCPNPLSITLPQLFEGKETACKSLSFLKGYGAANEIEAVLCRIAEDKLPLDQCTIITLGEGNYSALIYNLACEKNIPVTFGCGLPILYSNPARLLNLLHLFNTAGCNGIDALTAVIQSSAFDRKGFMEAICASDARELKQILEIAGNLRIGFDSAVNSNRIEAYMALEKDNPEKLCLLEKVRRFAEELGGGYSAIIQKFSVIRKDFSGRIDRSALSVICDTLEAHSRFSSDSSAETIIPELLKKAVCSELSREGALFVTGIDGGPSALRENLFIVGLSAAEFPGNPRENYLLLDSDLLIFSEASKAPTSNKLILDKKEALHRVLDLAVTLGSRVWLSYSDFDSAALKEQNPSSVIFEIYKKLRGEEVTTEELDREFKAASYFEQRLFAADRVGAAYTEGCELFFNPRSFDLPHEVVSKTKKFSPTAIETYFGCPRKFFFKYLLCLTEQQPDDPFAIIKANTFGTIAHELMEEQAKAPMTKAEFLRRAEKEFDRFLVTRPPMHRDHAQMERFRFLKQMETAFDTDPKNEVVSAETEIDVLHEGSGIILSGFPDRVEKTKAGKYIIADYKTKRKIEHIPHDVDSCIQVVLYAYMCNKNGIPVTECEYRYLNYGKTIPCRYDAEAENRLGEKLQEFAAALETGSFPTCQNGLACKWCKFTSLCPERRSINE